MYKVDLIENETILKSKELKDYESAFDCLNGLVKYLGQNRKIIIYEKKLNEWVKFGEVLLELDFSEKRIDYYMQEFRKVGFYELEEERAEYIKTLRETIKKEHERKNKKIVQI